MVFPEYQPQFLGLRNPRKMSLLKNQTPLISKTACAVGKKRRFPDLRKGKFAVIKPSGES